MLRFFLLLLLTGCVQSLSSNIKISPDVRDDSDYYKSLDNHTRSNTAYRDFELVFGVSATYLSPDFRKALSDRVVRLFAQPMPGLEENSTKAGFFVSAYGHRSREAVDLSNERIWSIKLEIKGQEGFLRPIRVERITEKDRWRPFFTDVTTWSEEFLVLFDTPSSSVNSEKLVDKNHMTLTIANARAQILLNW